MSANSHICEFYPFRVVNGVQTYSCVCGKISSIPGRFQP